MNASAAPQANKALSSVVSQSTFSNPCASGFLKTVPRPWIGGDHGAGDYMQRPGVSPT